MVWERILPSALESLHLPDVLENCFENLPYICLLLSPGAMGEASQRGGDTSDQVLHSVEEAEREGDTTGNQWQRKGKDGIPNLLNIICAMGRQESHSWQWDCGSSNLAPLA